ncbi:hypothetical protein C7Y70_19990 [Pseudoalteromonas sp. KS88]|uniref:hypothetical protein n=1 Tax=Pseudoalteromonas sp. KS88 TaxID=2109918 RepID=UPI0010805EC6|nr:hypothetical protein [Pseudoalteromonas sp. KS88]TGE76023.1 hypothetical protein C7Y70_19990 [Pseudoalteromonas sp. KS88]
MAQAVTVYRWDDPGAPQIVEGRPSEFINVLKKCLAEGYGNKTAVGWSIEDENIPEESPFLALKNNTSTGGSGGVLIASASNNNATNSIRLQSALDYISKSEQSRLGAYFYTSTGGSGIYYPNNWVIIASGTAFFYISHPEYRKSYNSFGASNHSVFFAGDFSSFYGFDSAKFITLAGKKNNSSISWNTQLNYVISDNYSSSVGYIYALDSSVSKSDSYLLTNFGNHALNQTSLQDSSPEIRILSPFLLSTGSNSLATAGTRGNSEVLPFIRGQIPGLFASQEFGYRSESMPFIKLIDGAQYYSVPRPNGGGTSIWINMEEWP